MATIGIWEEGRGGREAGDLKAILAGAGHVAVPLGPGGALAADMEALVAEAALLLRHESVVAARRAKAGPAGFPVLAVLPQGADAAAVAAALERADEVIRQPVVPAELAARVGILLTLVRQARDCCEQQACRERQEAALAAATADLSRRVRALDCLSEVHAVIQRFGQPKSRMFRDIVALLPPAMRRPEAAHARIVVGDNVVATPGFQAGPQCLRVPLGGLGQDVSALEVFYDEADPHAPASGFYEDEAELVRLVAQRLGRTLERLGAEAALAREREFSALLMNALPGGVIRLSRAGAIVFTNPRAAAILELQQRSLGANVYDDAGFGAADPDGRPLPRGEHPFARVLATGKPVYDVVLSVARPGGGRRFLSVSAAPLFAPDGTLDEVVANIVDVTGQKAMERQLAHSLKMESLGQLAAGVAHEINTPVQYVGGNLEFLANAFGRMIETLDRLAACALEGGGQDVALAEELSRLLGDEELRFLLEEAPAAIRESREGLDRVAAIVSSMKRFAHPGNESPMPVDLARAVADTLAVSRGTWKFVADVRLDLDPDLPPVLFVPGDCNQVLLNLIVNAAQAIEEKHGPKGSKGHIDIRAVRNGSRVELAIADDGPGIPEAIRQRIFDPFFTTKPVGKGTGQGLAIVHAILKRHKAGVEVLSTPGTGTSFVLTLPVAAQTGIGL
jgi:signal transduction histidine kinase